MRRPAPVQDPSDTGPPPATEERERASHAHVVLDAEVRRLMRELRAVGPMPSRSLARRCGASRWREGRFEAAVRRGVREGRLRRLPFGFLAAAGSPAPPQADGRPDPARGRF